MMDDDHWMTPVDPRSVCLDHALTEIARELHHPLDPIARVAITRTLEQLAADWPPRRSDAWEWA